jgi:general stress protein 26
MSDSSNGRTQLWDLIHDIKFAMFVTRHGNGHLHSRPMTTQNRELGDDDTLWFFMSRSGDPVDDLVAEPIVNLSYADTGSDRFVSVSGEARVVDNQAKTQELWSKMAQAWFPGGVDDPNLALIEVRIVHAHYWNVTESKITQLYLMAKAAMTGTQPEPMGQTGEVHLGDAASAESLDAGGSRDAPDTRSASGTHSALAKSEKEANAQQPENFKDVALQDKKVHIPPLSQDAAPIHGLDTK